MEGQTPPRVPEGFRRALAFSQMGLQLAATAGLGVAGGLWADRRLDSSPWGLVLGLFAGAGIGLTLFLRDAVRLSDSERGKKGK